MIDLTTSFNEAAAGQGGEAEALSSGPGPQGPAPSSVANEFTETPPNSIEILRTSAAFNADTPPSWRALPTYSGDVSRPTLTLDDAEAELKMLEAGRATKEHELNLDPPTYLKKIWDTKVEHDREARVGALQAYIEFKNGELDLADQQQSGAFTELDLLS